MKKLKCRLSFDQEKENLVYLMDPSKMGGQTEEFPPILSFSTTADVYKLDLDGNPSQAVGSIEFIEKVREK